MKIPLRIQFHNMEASAALEASAREHAHKLELFAPDIISCQVAIDLEQKHQQQGRPFGVRIDLTVPGRELVVNRVQHEDPYVALRDAFDGMKRQVQDAIHQRRGQEKQHVVPLRGEVARMDDDGGFGFIDSADGDEYYFSSVNVAGTSFDKLRPGDGVEFIPDAGGDGLQAKRVTLRR